jgi:hypothetical protein
LSSDGNATDNGMLWCPWLRHMYPKTPRAMVREWGVPMRYTCLLLNLRRIVYSNMPVGILEACLLAHEIVVPPPDVVVRNKIATSPLLRSWGQCHLLDRPSRGRHLRGRHLSGHIHGFVLNHAQSRSIGGGAETVLTIVPHGGGLRRGRRDLDKWVLAIAMDEAWFWRGNRHNAQGGSSLNCILRPQGSRWLVEGRRISPRLVHRQRPSALPRRGFADGGRQCLDKPTRLSLCGGSWRGRGVVMER